MSLFRNPSMGLIPDDYEAKAQNLMRAFLGAMKLPGLQCLRMPERDEGIRYAFLLWKDKSSEGCQIDMPLEPERHRLYVDGSSWLWSFAVGWARHHFTREKDDPDDQIERVV